MRRLVGLTIAAIMALSITSALMESRAAPSEPRIEPPDLLRIDVLRVVPRPEVSVQSACPSTGHAIRGEYLVSPDGTIDLRQYGTVQVAGKTLAEARHAVEKQLTQHFDSAEVAIEMARAKPAYYVITEGANLGDNIVRLPISGDETVSDAINKVGELSKLSRKQLKIWLTRPSPTGLGCEQVMPVDLKSITNGDKTKDLQVLPGDRVFIAEDELVVSKKNLSKILAPIERLLGLGPMGTGSSTDGTLRSLRSNTGGPASN